MGAARETNNLWWWVTNKFDFRKRHSLLGMVRRPYFWQDSFRTPFNRAIGCRFFGHSKNQSWLEEENGFEDKICWACYQHIERREATAANQLLGMMHLDSLKH